MLKAAKHVIVLDCVQTETLDRAEAALPAGTFAHSSGTLVNFEGRAQRFFAAMAGGAKERLGG